MEGTAETFDTSQTGAGPVLHMLWKHIFAHSWFQLVNMHENYIGLDMKFTNIFEKCNRICIP